MYLCWTVFDLELDKVVAYWYGDYAPTSWAKKYSDASRFEISKEYQGCGSNYSHAAGYSN